MFQNTFESFENAFFLIIWNFNQFNLSDERFKIDTFSQKLLHLVVLDRIIIVVLPQSLLSLGSEASIGFSLCFFSGKYKLKKKTFSCLIFSYGVQIAVTKVHIWVQVHVCTQGILNKFLQRVLSLAGLGQIHEPVVNYHCSGKPGLVNFAQFCMIFHFT